MPADGERVALDTSAAVPLLHLSHPAHGAVRRAVGRRTPVLTGHSLAETYSVLTRAPVALRLDPGDAVEVLEAEFGAAVCLAPDVAAQIPRQLAARGVSGGAVYDGLVALAAAGADLPLLTRDERARSTYVRLGVRFESVGS